MSTRHSIFFHEDSETKVSIHIYREMVDRTIRLEVSHPFGETNVLWPQQEFMREVFGSVLDKVHDTIRTYEGDLNPG